jgi:hypothetical protein
LVEDTPETFFTSFRFISNSTAWALSRCHRPSTITSRCISKELYLMAQSKEIMQILQSAIEEKKKKVTRPEILHHSYADRIYDEIETLQCLVAEIMD